MVSGEELPSSSSSFRKLGYRYSCLVLRSGSARFTSACFVRRNCLVSALCPIPSSPFQSLTHASAAQLYVVLLLPLAVAIAHPQRVFDLMYACTF